MRDKGKGSFVYIGKATYNRLIKRLGLKAKVIEEMVSDLGKRIVKLQARSGMNTSVKRFIYNNPEGKFLIGDGVNDDKANKVKITKVLKKVWGIDDPQELRRLKAVWESWYATNIRVSSDVVGIYNMRHSEKGTIGNSCMRGKGRFYICLSDTLGEKLKVAYILRGGIVVARALVWEVDEVIDLDTGEEFENITFMDRRYYSNESCEEALKKWAREKGFWLRKYNSYEDTEYVIDDKGEERRVQMIVRGKYMELDTCAFPYMDTMYVVMQGYDEVVLTNIEDLEYIDTDKVTKICILRNTDGECEKFGICTICGEVVRYESLTCTYDGEVVCERCLEEDYVYCNDINDYVLKDKATRCCFCGRWYYDRLLPFEDCYGNRCRICEECIDANELKWSVIREAYTNCRE